MFRKARAPTRASAAITWCSGWTGPRRASPRWAAKAPTGSGRRRSRPGAHVFQNLGDGTYLHSGSLAIRAAVAAGVNITFKLLYNDAVAMTGGQPVEGSPSVQRIAREIAAEGVEAHRDRHGRAGEIWLAAAFWRSRVSRAGRAIHHRDDLDAVQRELQDVEGVTVLIYDQTCAAEKRRRRKRGRYPDPAKRVIINESLCEGAAIAACSRTAWRSRPSRPSTDASAPSISRRAIRISRASRVSARALSPCTAASSGKGRARGLTRGSTALAVAGDPPAPRAAQPWSGHIRWSSPASAEQASSPSAP